MEDAREILSKRKEREKLIAEIVKEYEDLLDELVAENEDLKKELNDLFKIYSQDELKTIQNIMNKEIQRRANRGDS